MKKAATSVTKITRPKSNKKVSKLKNTQRLQTAVSYKKQQMAKKKLTK